MSITFRIFRRVLAGFVIFSVINYAISIFIENLSLVVKILWWDLSKYFESVIIFMVNMLLFIGLYGLRMYGAKT